MGFPWRSTTVTGTSTRCTFTVSFTWPRTAPAVSSRMLVIETSARMGVSYLATGRVAYLLLLGGSYKLANTNVLQAVLSWLPRACIVSDWRRWRGRRGRSTARRRSIRRRGRSEWPDHPLRHRNASARRFRQRTSRAGCAHRRENRHGGQGERGVPAHARR